MTDTTALILAPSDLGTSTLDRWVELAGLVDLAGWPMLLIEAQHASDPIDGLAMAAFLASRTQRVGLCATIDPATFEPFTLARGLATLDHLSGGRAAWRLTGDDSGRTAELVAVVRKLLESWGADALIEDRDNGMLSDADAVSAPNHEGAFFSVRGPLNIPRPPQGVPPLLALPGDTTEGADLRVTEAQILRCSIDEATALLDHHAPATGDSLRARLGIAA